MAEKGMVASSDAFKERVKAGDRPKMPSTHWTLRASPPCIGMPRTSGAGLSRAASLL